MLSSNEKDCSSSNPTTNLALIEKLFDLKRIESVSDICWVLLYSPIGLCLFIIRFFIFLYVLIISAILPYNSSFRRSLFFILGISINVDEEYFKNLKAKFFISNHISDLDPLVLNLILPCSYVSASVSPSYINWLCHMVKDDDENTYKMTMKNSPIVCFPEQSKSNGKYGLFKFNIFHHVSNAHLIFLETKRPFFNVNVSPLGAHWLIDMFWILFLPITIFKIRHLGNVSKQENETYEEFVKRTQKEMATKTNLEATDYNVYDKNEFVKRLNTEANFRNTLLQNSLKIQTSKNNSIIDDYSRKVKEILPQVPFNVIREDIILTNNIDNTIERILNGYVKYQPESETTSTNCSSLNSGKNESDGNITRTFGKTPEERIASFEERKAQMYRMAKIRYIQKYGLN